MLLVLVLIIVLVVVGYAVIDRVRHDGRIERQWSAEAFRLPSTIDPSPPLARPTSQRARVIASLGRIEAGRLATHPAYVIGIAFCIVVDLLFFVTSDSDSGASWRDLLLLFPVVLHPLVGMAVVATHRNVLRSKRDGTDELFDSTPTRRRDRTVAHLTTAWVVVVTAVLFLASQVVLHLTQSDLAFGRVDARSVADVATGLVLAIGGVALGVALARWLPWSLAPVVALVAIAAVSSGIGAIGENHWSHMRQLSTWPRYPEHDLIFTARPAWWHVVYLAGLVLVTIVVARLRHGASTAMLTSAAAALAVAIFGGVLATRPIGDADAERIASMISHPDRYQTCVGASRAHACAFTDYAELAAYYEPAISAVVAAAPPQFVRGDLYARQLFNQAPERLDPDVRRRLDGIAQPDDHVILLPYAVHSELERGVRLRTALWLIGMNTRDLEQPCFVGGSARGIVALWLAFQDRPGEDADDLVHGASLTDDTSVDPAFVYGFVFPTDEEVALGWAPAVWSPEDIVSARALLRLPDEEVRATIAAGWLELTRPTTPSATLLDRVGLDAPNPQPVVPEGAVECS